MPATDFPAVSVFQTINPSTSTSTKSPAAVKFSIAFSRTGCLADHTNLDCPGDSVDGEMNMAK
ncbi:hypothetical protein HanXRQr2_Chr13g0567121 [Helianthus annuus]|uniref:Uncharacterized protein n=1 Tax=Helianthus annuus TaxID=4232 RepID=A0A251SMU0_HELAN|nr:hypothetical protein HanXRQr2_Chr13g0567121 [Helianthus annuus]KAJ0475388.1 hypothetical protein HanHA300_Chr13g0464871 [Helianthus annuus]KAJ0479252.1 hypothetical protein HanIR_Chr13g0617931 [Helianthus annuus]KAJ0496192.1 hypothetical protein HanHA89_Chr13g0496901 [Helianthus annuus]KAJ0662266.1 hypothetical protein HanLR1_Chr13g0467481 [Helianthus annuus]